MPPSDPRLCPALERALPGDDKGATEERTVRDPWEAVFGDGDWHYVEARSWWRDRHRRWVVLVEWSAGGELWTETYRYDPQLIRPAVAGAWMPPL